MKDSTRFTLKFSKTMCKDTFFRDKLIHFRFKQITLQQKSIKIKISPVNNHQYPPISININQYQSISTNIFQYPSPITKK